MPKSLILAAFLSFFVFIACKKGVDDPAISLVSRTARMAGNWELVSGYLKVNGVKDGKTTTYEYAIEGPGVTLTITSAGTPTTFFAAYSLKLNMTKNGEFDFTEMFGQDQLKASGRWSFNSGAGESKKKADVIYVLDKVQEGATTDGYLFNRLNTNFEYFIRELRNKKLVLESSSFVYINANGEYQGMEGTLIFEQ